ncbi:16S rRNA (cytidine(1402)-2'-O)-methyltransferase [Prosthecochloris sp. GSB1]|uniref:16S rRNA (cytidine(1402)-2'-O)-methyltransferase n=1 Tax=Prosthecochloris sp. GSB1 TaxID=281093 RepID=UPI000B8C7FF4|nr:16S rRNA (cytidine(1402)-2'-O)-methyltransferase [Prosthecochloris sp. GSB1]ASQ91738.1 16S rRNA (cytidine(1402)-2'-O)-methyltransferase [Prosthecochloris sp. GSB1]
MDDTAATGTLYIVATPLGNLEDITLRAISTLQSVDTIACEDTRRTSILLRHFGIEGKKLLSYHAFNENRAIQIVMKLLENGSSVAVVTDAGTPAISDPGFAMVRAAFELPARVIPVPGPSAVTAALSACPLPLHNFFFAGFLPHKKGRKSKLGYLASIASTVVFYEAPGRIGRLLEEIDEHFPGADVFIAREITKMHEEYVRGSATELLEHFTGKKTRGEFVVVVHPTSRKPEKEKG